MNKIITLLLVTGASFPLLAQLEFASTGSISGNEINAQLTDYNVFFQNDETSTPGFEFPKGSGNHMLFSGGAWFGAVDESGDLHMAATLFEPGDLFPGALTVDGSAEAVSPPASAGIFNVSREEILDHAANYSDPGYVMPEDIANWPANGDVSLGIAANLAPYFDYNGNGFYDPENGDYPEIRGDHAAYFIMNDKADEHVTGGLPLGIEVHVMAYQYEGGSFLDSTLFMNYRVINRSTTNYPEFIFSNWFDTDVGFSDDDYVGCDSANNVAFGYNASLEDSQYGMNPPALGVTTLNYDMGAFIYYERTGVGINSEPVTPADFWNYMNARWKDGTLVTYGGSGMMGEVPTNYMFNGNPNSDGPDEWTEGNEGNPAGDRRFVISSESMSLPAGGSLCFDQAIFTERVGDTFENAERMITLAPDIQLFYSEEPNTYCSYFVGLSEEEMDEPSLLVFPNPSQGEFTVQFEGEFDLDLISIDGRIIYREIGAVNSAHIQENLAAGTYYIRVKQGEEFHQQKLIVQ